ncbi:hypothetical protein BDZ91DRAFT_712788 [Kalaharituber pfeilii]|nr:hypothetical protein BDZ91DRAFT_712788 [Kalaharituber pfeilii]
MSSPTSTTAEPASSFRLSVPPQLRSPTPPAAPRRPPLRSRPLSIRSTPPTRQSFPLPSTRFFTGALFDSIVIFLQKNAIEWQDIQCVARGIHPEVAIPTICIYITSPLDMDEVVRLWNEHGRECHDTETSSSSISASRKPNTHQVLANLEQMIPDEIAEVEFVAVFGNLAMGRDMLASRRGYSVGVSGLSGVGGMVGSFTSSKSTPVKHAAARSEVFVKTCTSSLIITEGSQEGELIKE